MERLQVLVTAEEKAAFRKISEEEGLSLSAWLRQAGMSRLAERKQRMKIHTVEELRAFFQACDQRETGDEPDWEDHQRVMKKSVCSGSSDT